MGGNVGEVEKGKGTSSDHFSGSTGGHAGQHEGGAAVESVPSHPEDKSAESLEYDGLLGELDALIKAANAGADDSGSNKSSNSSGKVDDTRSGKVSDSAVKEKIRRPPGSSPSRVPPDVDNDRIDEGG